MPVSLTIRDVPEHTRDVLADRAARAGMSPEDYVRAELNASADRPSPDEFWDRVRSRVRVTGTRFPVDAVLEARNLDRR
jgi:hypothetical protein